MHSELQKLLELQSQDDVVAEVAERIARVDIAIAALDLAVADARTAAEAARRAAVDSVRRREELEVKVENYRAVQQQRQARVDQVRNAKEAGAAMAELDMASRILANEETEWIKSAELVERRDLEAQEREAQLADAETAQRPERAALEAQRQELQQEYDAAVATREAAASQVERSLRIRYDRLRGARGTAVLVPLVGSTCGACFTAVPLHRRSRIRSGDAIDGCEACGVILYPAQVD